MNKIICDLCDDEVKEAFKDDGIWVCHKCNIKYPKKENNNDENSTM